MACENMTVPGQSLSDRVREVKEAVRSLDEALRQRRVTINIGPQGAIAFEGWTNRARVTDGCAYRRLMATGTALARAEIAKAEQLSGRVVNSRAGVHSHGGIWHDDHK